MFKDKYSQSTTTSQNKIPYRTNSFKEKSLFRQPNEKKFIMNEIEFPVFSNKNNNPKEEAELKTTTPNLSSMYLEKIKTEHLLEVQYSIEPGWVEIQYNPTNNTKSIQYGKTIKDQHTTTRPTFVDVLEKLNVQYISWKNNYIETWGEEEYHFLYNFPNYDYDYYEKLDETVMEEVDYTHEDEYE